MKATVPQRPGVNGVRCTGKVIAKCHGCDRAGLYEPPGDGLCVPCQEGAHVEGGGEYPTQQCAQCFLPVGTTSGHFLLRGWGGKREVLAPRSAEEVERMAGRPHQCNVAKVCH